MGFVVRRPLLVAAVCAVASGAMLWLASPAVGLGWLAWLAIAPAAAVALGAPDPRAARLAVPLAYAIYLELLLIPALPFGIAEGQWGETPVPLMVGDSPVLVVAIVAVPAFCALLWLARFGQPVGAALLPARVRPAAYVLLPAAAWTAVDLLRVELDPGGLFGPLFLTQAGTEAGRLAAVGGPWLVSFAVAACGYALALAALRLSAAAGRAPAASRRLRRVLAAAAPVVAVAAAVAGAAAAAPAGGGRPALRLAVVQPGYDTAEESRPVLRYFAPGTYGLSALDLVRDLSGPTLRAAAGGADVVVWPEAVAWTDPRRDARVGAALERLARRGGVVLVAPFFVPGPDHGAALTVTAGGLGRAQPKQRPMWFLGERGGNRRPPRPVRLGAFGRPNERFGGGRPPPNRETGPATVGTLLGVDNQDPGTARALAARGATLLASSTHDWEQLSTYQRAMARVHAVATGRPLARADWRYGSSIVSPEGRELAVAEGGKRRTTLVAAVQPAHETPYDSIGDALGLAALAVFALASMLAAAARVRRPVSASAR